jgi:hypothetical protein
MNPSRIVFAVVALGIVACGESSGDGFDPPSRSRVFAIEAEVRGSVGLPGDSCRRLTARYEVDLDAPHARITRCVGGTKTEDPWSTQVTLDRALTAAERESIEQRYAALRERPMPSECNRHDGRARRLELGGEAAGTTYFEADGDCLRREDVRYTDSLFPLVEALSNLDGHPEPPAWVP